MNSIQDLLAGMFRQRPPREDEYLNEKDGLVYCRSCHTPRERMIPLRDGGVFRAPSMCTCLRERADAREREMIARKNTEEIERLKREGLQNKALYHYTFENDKGYNPEIKHARTFVDHFQEIEASGKGLLLWGDVGTGKTFIAACIANALMEQRIPVYMTNFSRVMNNMLGMGGAERNNYLDRLNHYRLLVIDDLGMERNSSYALEQIYNVIDSRCQSEKPMIITTNLTVEQMRSEMDLSRARIYDRVLACCYPIMVSNMRIRENAALDNFAEARRLFG